MNNVEWLETFELGVPEIDGDHRTIVDLMKAIEAALSAGHRKQAVRLIDRLVAFAEDHFRREEALLVAWGYPEVTTHCQYHRGLVETVDRIKEACLEKGDTGSFEACCEEMMRYIVDDVVQGDMHLKSYLQYSDLVVTQ